MLKVSTGIYPMSSNGTVQLTGLTSRVYRTAAELSPIIIYTDLLGLSISVTASPRTFPNILDGQISASPQSLGSSSLLRTFETLVLDLSASSVYFSLSSFLPFSLISRYLDLCYCFTGKLSSHSSNALACVLSAHNIDHITFR